MRIKGRSLSLACLKNGFQLRVCPNINHFQRKEISAALCAPRTKLLSIHDNLHELNQKTLTRALHLALA